MFIFKYPYLLLSLFILTLLSAGCSTSMKIKEKEIKLTLEEIPGSHFIKGMKGAENIYLDDTSMKVYAGDLYGNLILLDGPAYSDLRILKTLQLKGYLLGMAKGPDNLFYVARCTYTTEKEWVKKGGAVYRADPDLKNLTRITGEYPGINGLTVDRGGILYFASSNFNILSPKGAVYAMDTAKSSEPAVYIKKGGLANGLYYDKKKDTIYFSNTLKGAFSFTPSSPQVQPVYRGAGFMEAVDDLCTDSKGRIWMTDPGKSFIKCYDSSSNRLYRFFVQGIGQTSSCRIREEQGKEILYVTELKTTQKVMSKVFDGRGILIMPLESLTAYF